MGYTLYCAPSLRLQPARHSRPTTTALGDWHAASLNIGWHRLVVCVSSNGQVPLITTARQPASLPTRISSALERLLRRLAIDATLVDAEIAAMAPTAVAVGIAPELLSVTREYGWAVRDLLRAPDAPLTLDDVTWMVNTGRGLDARLAALLGD